MLSTKSLPLLICAKQKKRRKFYKKAADFNKIAIFAVQSNKIMWRDAKTVALFLQDCTIIMRM
jgi:hypothetical protein